ncbi:MAG TPA: S41 family peptidase [Planctomycetota bacterium]
MFWLAVSLLAGGAPNDVEIRGMRHPALSPDGRRLAFAWRGDLWICPAEGGPAERVTTDPGDERKPCWSPDGLRLAYAGDANGTLDLYVLDLATREARRLTRHTADDDAPAWSPDGAWIAFQSNRDSNLDLALNDDVFDVWKMPSGGGTATRVTRFRGENPAWSADGKWIAYDRYATGYGDGEHNVFIVDADGRGTPREVASGREDSRRPAFRGRTLYFAHETHGFRNIWKTALDGGPLYQVTGHRGDHVTWPTARGDTLVYEYDFDFYCLDLRAPRPEPRKLAIRAEAPPEPPPARETLASGLRAPAWSPSGRRLAFSAGGRIWTSSSDGGAARVVTAGPGEDRDPAWAADEASLVYVSAPPGLPGHVWRSPLDGGTPIRISREEAAYRTPRPSPDGRELLVVVGEGAAADVRVIDAKSGAARDVAAKQGTAEFSPCWSADGRSIYFLKDGEQGTSILRAPRDGGPAFEIRGPTARRDGLEASPDGKRLAWEQGKNVRVALIDGGEEPALVGRGVGRPSWSPDSSMLAAEVPGRALLVLDAGGASRLPLEIRVERDIPRAEESRALFGQVWAAYWGSYYDPFFHGVDMMALRAKYLPVAEACRTRGELYDVINDMLRELKSSHIHLKPPAPKTGPPTGALGADLERGADGGFALRRIEPGGPAAKAGLRDGDVLELPAAEDLDALLAAEAELKLRTSEGTRTVKVLGIPRTALRELKYANTIEARKARVRELSNGRLGYFHIRMMAAPEVARLKEALEKEFPEAEGLVLDERDGVGGFAHRPVCALLDSTAPERLNRNPACAMRNRDGSMVKDVYGDPRPPARSWNKPVVMIQNEVSRSDKEILPHTFRHLGLGYLVGMPTAGGVIGGNEWTMRDGSRIIVSVQGWFTLDGRNMEGWGVPPDFRVPLTHDDLYAGRDPQIDKAVEVLLAQMDGRLAPPRKREVENK